MGGSEGVTFLTKKKRGSLVGVPSPGSATALFNALVVKSLLHTVFLLFSYSRSVLFLNIFSGCFAVVGYLYRKEPFGVL